MRERNYWRIWYSVVFLFLLIQVLVFYWLTQHFNQS